MEECEKVMWLTQLRVIRYEINIFTITVETCLLPPIFSPHETWATSWITSALIPCVTNITPHNKRCTQYYHSCHTNQDLWYAYHLYTHIVCNIIPWCHIGLYFSSCVFQWSKTGYSVLTKSVNMSLLVHILSYPSVTSLHNIFITIIKFFIYLSDSFSKWPIQITAHLYYWISFDK